MEQNYAIFIIRMHKYVMFLGSIMIFLFGSVVSLLFSFCFEKNKSYNKQQ